MTTDNVTLPATGAKVATRGVTYSGEEAAMQAVSLAVVTGPDDDKVAADVTSGNPLPVDASYGELVESLESLRVAVQALTRSGLGQTMPDTAMRLRVALDAISASLTLATITTVGTVTTVTTVSTVTNQSQLGGFAAQDQIPALMRMAADSSRRNITVT